MVVHELEFEDIAAMQIYTICSRVTGILILIGSSGCLKEVNTMEMILGKCKYPNSSLPYFQCAHWNCLNVYLQHITFQ